MPNFICPQDLNGINPDVSSPVDKMDKIIKAIDAIEKDLVEIREQIHGNRYWSESN